MKPNEFDLRACHMVSKDKQSIRRRTVVQTLLMCFVICTALAEQGPGDWENKYWDSTAKVRLGDSAKTIATTLEPPWVAVGTSIFLKKYPFREWVPYTNMATVLEWRSREEMSNGWPLIVFAVFSDENKTNLIDAILYDGGSGIQPLVEGLYDKNVKSINEGESMDTVFRLLGRINCRYYRAADGKFRVRAMYMRYKGNLVEIEADAGSGRVLRVSPSVIQ